MSPGTVREYVVRLRRLGNHLHEQNISLDQLQDGFLDEILARGCPHQHQQLPHRVTEVSTLSAPNLYRTCAEILQPACF